MSKATLNLTLTQLKRFFQWLSDKPGYKSHFRCSDADYFNLSEKDTRVASARRENHGPTVDQVRHVIHTMRYSTDIERRNRALVAFTLLTGARDSAIASMKLKHVDLTADCVYQDAREVKTKFSKTFMTFFFPVGGEIRAIVEDWLLYLIEEKLWGTDDPLFPATEIAVGADRQFKVSGLQRAHWNSASPIRSIFRAAFANAGLPYFNPHSFRNTLVRLGLSYGEVASPRQAEIMRDLARPQEPVRSSAEDIAEALFRKLRDPAAGLDIATHG